jgi:hypothetical protein
MEAMTGAQETEVKAETGAQSATTHASTLLIMAAMMAARDRILTFVILVLTATTAARKCQAGTNAQPSSRETEMEAMTGAQVHVMS